MSVPLQTKWLWVHVPLHSLKIFGVAQSPSIQDPLDLRVMQAKGINFSNTFNLQYLNLCIKWHILIYWSQCQLFILGFLFICNKHVGYRKISFVLNSPRINNSNKMCKVSVKFLSIHIYNTHTSLRGQRCSGNLSSF